MPVSFEPIASNYMLGLNETRLPEVVRAQPELVVHRFTEARLSDAAIVFSVALDLLTRRGFAYPITSSASAGVRLGPLRGA
jgi:hypothetical protein